MTGSGDTDLRHSSATEASAKSVICEIFGPASAAGEGKWSPKHFFDDVTWIRVRTNRGQPSSVQIFFAPCGQSGEQRLLSPSSGENTRFRANGLDGPSDRPVRTSSDAAGNGFPGAENFPGQFNASKGLQLPGIASAHT